ncbi:MAG: hypothetical protein ACM3SV_04180 [Betaproteobacteria bacterium]
MSAVYGVAACALLVAAAACLCLRATGGEHRWWLPLAAFALALIPLSGETGIAVALHGALAAPSFTLAQLALLAILNRPMPAQSNPLLAGFVVLALGFYLFALGFGPVDPYGFGYRSQLLPLALVPLAIWFWRRRLDGWLLILAFDLAAYASGLIPNFWDALFDPVLFALALYRLFRSGARAA